MPEAATKPPANAEETCPTCGAPADRGQLVCLECGGRIALDYRRPPSWKVPVAIVGSVIVAAAVAFGFFLRDVTNDADSEVAKTQSGKRAAAAAPARGKPQKSVAKKPAAKKPAAKKPARRKPAVKPKPTHLVQSWPAKNAFTVILISAGDRSSAGDVAAAAAKSGLDAGVLRSDDYSSLTSGFWIVFSGQYRSRAKAEKAAAKLSGRYPGAYVQFVNGAGKR